MGWAAEFPDMDEPYWLSEFHSVAPAKLILATRRRRMALSDLVGTPKRSWAPTPADPNSAPANLVRAKNHAWAQRRRRATMTWHSAAPLRTGCPPDSLRLKHPRGPEIFGPSDHSAFPMAQGSHDRGRGTLPKTPHQVRVDSKSRSNRRGSPRIPRPALEGPSGCDQDGLSWSNGVVCRGKSPRIPPFERVGSVELGQAKAARSQVLSLACEIDASPFAPSVASRGCSLSRSQGALRDSEGIRAVGCMLDHQYGRVFGWGADDRTGNWSIIDGKG